MAEMRTVGCPACEAPNQPLAVVEGIEEYRCRACGVLYYGPCGCDTVHENGGEALLVGAPVATSTARDNGGGLPEGFEMLLPALSVANASYVQKYPGCS